MRDIKQEGKKYKIDKKYNYSKAEVEIGDFKSPDTNYPQAKLKYWDNECNFSLRYKYDEVDSEFEVKDKKIKWQSKDKKREVNFYELDETIAEDGGFEIEVILNEKPEKNVIEYSIETKGLDFFKQPELTQEEIDAGHSRPDNVVGSYAVYHKKSQNYIKNKIDKFTGQEYKTGKAFHIFRPKAIDKKGNEVWCDIVILEPFIKKLLIIIPQDFLDNAKYPVIVDPTIGNTSNGFSGLTLSSDNFAVAIDLYYATTATSTTIDSIFVYANGYISGGPDQIKGCIWNKSDGALLTNGSGSVANLPIFTGSWSESTYSTSPSISSGNNYYLGFVYNKVTTGSGSIKYDNTNNIYTGITKTSINFESPSAISSPTTTTNRFSIYAEVTESYPDPPSFWFRKDSTNYEIPTTRDGSTMFRRIGFYDGYTKLYAQLGYTTSNCATDALVKYDGEHYALFNTLVEDATINLYDYSTAYGTSSGTQSARLYVRKIVVTEDGYLKTFIIRSSGNVYKLLLFDSTGILLKNFGEYYLSFGEVIKNVDPLWITTGTYYIGYVGYSYYVYVSTPSGSGGLLAGYDYDNPSDFIVGNLTDNTYPGISVEIYEEQTYTDCSSGGSTKVLNSTTNVVTTLDAIALDRKYDLNSTINTVTTAVNDIEMDISSSGGGGSYVDIQRNTYNIGNTTEYDAPTTDFASVASAFVLNKSNRFGNSGASTADAATYNVDDLGGSIQLLNVDSIEVKRLTSGATNDFRFDWESLEYLGDAGGDNEFKVISRNTVSLTGSSTTQALDSTPTSYSDCIPFITGITNTDTGANSNGLTAIVTVSGGNVNVSRGGSTGTTVVQIVVVEFTGANWSVYTGSQSATTSDSGSMTLNGTISDTANAFVAQMQSLAASGDIDEAIADNYPLAEIATTTTVNWTFHTDHSATNSERVYVLENPDINVTRYSDTSSTEGVTNINITSAGLTDISKAAIFGTSTSSGTGTAFARGWRNYAITSLTNAVHFCHRSGNTMAHRIEIVDFSAMPVSSDGVAWNLNSTINNTSVTYTADLDVVPTGSARALNSTINTVSTAVSTITHIPASTGGWVSHFNNSDWTPADHFGVGSTCSWDSGNSEWDSNNFMDMYFIVDLSELSTWVNSYRPTKMRLTFTGGNDVAVSLSYDTGATNPMYTSPVDTYNVSSGDELTLDWTDNTDISFLMIFNMTGVFSVTNIEFYEE